MEENKLPLKETLEKNLNTIINFVTTHDSVAIQSYVDKLSNQNPTLSNNELAKKILSRKSLKNGFVGAIAGLGGTLHYPLPYLLI